jgi:hypothetical protein
MLTLLFIGYELGVVLSEIHEYLPILVCIVFQIHSLYTLYNKEQNVSQIAFSGSIGFIFIFLLPPIAMRLLSGTILLLLPTILSITKNIDMFFDGTNRD